jgi:hypothetical protein
MGKDFERLLSTIESDPLSRTLPRVIRLAQTAGERDLENWARLELHGYWRGNPAMSEQVVIPDYRTVAGQWSDDYGRPLVIQQAELGFVNEIRLREGAVELEGLVGAKGPLAFRLPEFTYIIRQNLHVEVSTFTFDPRVLPVILAAIKTETSDRLVACRTVLAPNVPTSESVSDVQILQLKPSLYGMSVDLRAAWRRIQQWRRERE